MKEAKKRSSVELVAKGPDFEIIFKLFELQSQQKEISRLLKANLSLEEKGLSELFRVALRRLADHIDNPHCQRCLCGGVLDPEELASMQLRLQGYLATPEPDKEPPVQTASRQSGSDQVAS